MLDIEKMINRRKRIRAKLTITADELEQEVQKGTSGDKFKLTGSLAILLSLKSELTALDNNILPLQEDTCNDDELEAEEEQIMKYKTMVIDIEARANLLLDDMKALINAGASTNSSNQVSQDQNAKLPKINVPVFSGKIEEWRTWYSIFKALVYDRNIPVIEKFSYLISSLDGEAKAMLKGIQLREANFEPCLSTLKERFGDTTTLLCVHVVSLHKLNPVADNAQPNKVRAMVNEFESHVREVRSILEEIGEEMSQPQSNDLDFLCNIFLSPLLMSKLPDSIMTEWNRKANKTKDRFQYSVLLAFVKSELESKETLSLTKASKEDRTQSRYKASEANGASASCTFSSNTGKSCLCCQQSPWHKFSECQVFLLEMDVHQRKKFLESKHSCLLCFGTKHDADQCRSKQRCHLCRQKHNTLLHVESKPRNRQREHQNQTRGPTHSTMNTAGQSPADQAHKFSEQPSFSSSEPWAECGNKTPENTWVPRSSSHAESTSKRSVNSTSLSPTSESILETVRVRVRGPKGETVIRVFLDSGSDTSFIRSDVASYLGLPALDEKWSETVVFGGGIKRELRRLVPIQMFPLSGSDMPYNFSFWTSNHLTTNLGKVKLTPEILFHGPFSDDYDDPEPREIHALIGTDFYNEVVAGIVKRVGKRVVIKDSIFGRFVHGSLDLPGQNRQSSRVCFIKTQAIEDSWNLASIGIKEEELSTTEFTTPELVDGRIQVKIPWKNNIRPSINFPSAVTRLNSLLGKMTTEQQVSYQQYLDDMTLKEYVEKVDLSNPAEADPGYYLPHRGIVQKSKLRVVFDGGAHGRGLPSINDLVDQGPNLLQNLVKVLLRFRYSEEPLVNDLKAAFLQIRVHPDDRKYLRFLWKDGTVYQFQKVLFGLSCSPFLLNISLQFLFDLFQEVYPVTVQTLRKSMYMDDIVASVTKEEKESFKHEATEIFNSVGFELKEWTEKSTSSSEELHESSVLGMNWNQGNDTLTVKDPLTMKIDLAAPADSITRRKLLRAVSTPFDPLGIINPWLVKGRSLLQDSWLEKKKWDDPLSSNLQKRVREWIHSAPDFRSLQIPRRVGALSPLTSELHIFCDSSESAFAASIYVVCRPFSSNLLISRFRVAPIKKTISIPRLELLGALLGVRLAKFVSESDEMIQHMKKIFWTDSEAVRHWIKNGPHSLKVFESNRVKEILQTTKSEDWRRIPTSENPADLATRGIRIKNDTKLWWQGPEFLLKDESEWPQQPLEQMAKDAMHPCSLTTVASNKTETYPRIQMPPLRFNIRSKFQATVRVMAYVFKFVQTLKDKIKPKTSDQRNETFRKTKSKLLLPTTIEVKLTRKHFQMARHFIIRVGQCQEFELDFERLKAGKDVLHSSRLRHLRPFFDKERNLIMIHPRNDESNPLPLLSTSFPYFKWIVQDRHIRVYHCGPQATLAELLRSFHVLKGLQAVKTALRITCFECRRTKGIPFRSTEAPLPDFRKNPSRPFSHTGVDFLGPVRADGSKCYILLFTCAVVRAIHLELTHSMNVADAQMAFRRFHARRGAPVKFYSDNASNFLKLKSMSHGEWSLIPPYAPWWGGFYERMVKSVKECLRSALMKRNVSFIELQTILTEIEEAINRRPLHQVSNQDVPLTPAHFLFGAAPESDSEDVPDFSQAMLGKMWKNRLQISHEFWRKFRTRYLATLRNWRTQKMNILRRPKIGEIVMVEDKTVPRLRWNFAKILELNPHSAVILLKGKRTSRAIKCLYPLESEAEIEAIGLRENVPELHSAVLINTV